MAIYPNKIPKAHNLYLNITSLITNATCLPQNYFLLVKSATTDEMEAESWPDTPRTASTLLQVGLRCPHDGVVRHVVVGCEQLHLCSEKKKKKLSSQYSKFDLTNVTGKNYLYFHCIFFYLRKVAEINEINEIN